MFHYIQRTFLILLDTENLSSCEVHSESRLQTRCSCSVQFSCCCLLSSFGLILPSLNLNPPGLEPEPLKTASTILFGSSFHIGKLCSIKNILQGYKMLILFAKCTFFGIYIFATFHIYLVYWMRKRKRKYFICKYYFMRSLMYNNHMAMTSSKGGT